MVTSTRPLGDKLADRLKHAVSDDSAEGISGPGLAEIEARLPPEFHRLGDYVSVVPHVAVKTSTYNINDGSPVALNPGDKYLAMHLRFTGRQDKPLKTFLREMEQGLILHDLPQLARAIDEGQFGDVKLIVSTSHLLKSRHERLGFTVSDSQFSDHLMSGIAFAAEAVASSPKMGLMNLGRNLAKPQRTGVITPERLDENFGTLEKAEKTWEKYMKPR